MIPRRSRLTRLALKEFEERPQRFIGSHYTLQFRRSIKTEEKSRFSCVVSKKEAPKAIDRVRIKRRSRAALARVLFVTSPAPGAYIFHARHSVGSASFAGLVEDLRAVIERAGKGIS